MADDVPKAPEKPVLVHAETIGPASLSPVSLPLPVAPTPPPVPAPRKLAPTAPALPTFQPFSWLATQPLSPSEIDVITTFHAQYMQGPWLSDDPDRFLQCQRAALIVKPLMERQLTLAQHGPEGAKGGEAQTIAVNLQWVTDLLLVEV